jgi:site-specific DNA-cytosine methylase
VPQNREFLSRDGGICTSFGVPQNREFLFGVSQNREFLFGVPQNREFLFRDSAICTSFEFLTENVVRIYQ